MDNPQAAAESKFTVDLSGLQLSETERVHLSGVILRSAMNEVARMSIDRGRGISLDLGTKFDPRIDGGKLIAKLLPISQG